VFKGLIKTFMYFGTIIH